MGLYAPNILFSPLLRAFMALLIGWILFSLTQHFGGFVGWPITLLSLGLALLVLISNHVVVAIHGFPTTSGVASGWEWMYPSTLLLANWSALVGLGGCALLCHKGGGTLGTLAGIFMQSAQ